MSLEIAVETINILECSLPSFGPFSQVLVGIIIVILNQKISEDYCLCVPTKFYSHIFTTSSHIHTCFSRSVCSSLRTCCVGRRGCSQKATLEGGYDIS